VLAIATTPVLRALLRAYLRTPKGRAGNTVLGLSEDLLRIDVVRRIRGGILPGVPFGIELEFDAPDGILLLKATVAPGSQSPRINPLPADVDAALLAGRIRTIIWSYTPAASRAPWPQPARPAIVGLGRGIHRFDALSAICVQAPDAARALRAILSGEPSPREQRQIVMAKAS
jgi:hypothetical protein